MIFMGLNTMFLIALGAISWRALVALVIFNTIVFCLLIRNPME